MYKGCFWVLETDSQWWRKLWASSSVSSLTSEKNEEKGQWLAQLLSGLVKRRRQSQAKFFKGGVSSRPVRWLGALMLTNCPKRACFILDPREAQSGLSWLHLFLPKVWDCGDVNSLWLGSLAREEVGRRGSETLSPSGLHPSFLFCLTPHLPGLGSCPSAASLVFRVHFFFLGNKWWINSLLVISFPMSISLQAWFTKIHSPLPLPTYWRWPWEFWFCSF